MDRVEVIAAAVHQAWFSALRMSDVDVKAWDQAVEWQKSAVYHAVRFLEALDVDNYTLEKLVEASSFAWKNYAIREGNPFPLMGPRLMSAMVKTYLVMRNALGIPLFTQ